MTGIPQNTVTQADINAWYEMQEQLKKLKASEMILRTKIFKAFFPTPKEGTNTAPLAEGWVIKGTFSIIREIDVGALDALGEVFEKAHISKDKLVKYTPSLKKAEYNTLTEEQKKLFDNALIIKPGSPSLEIVLPAKAAK
jgi:hypothetical protein